MTDWRILSTDLTTGELGPAVPLQAATWTQRWGRPDELEATLPLRRCPPALLEGSRLVLHLEVGGLLVAHAVCWDVRPNRTDTASVDVRGAGLESYWDRRRLRTPLEFIQVDEATIVADLVDLTENGVGVGIDTSQVTPTGRLRDRTDWNPEDRPLIGHLIRLLTEVVDGPHVDVTTPWPDPALPPGRVLRVRPDGAGATVPGVLRLGEAITGYDLQILGSQQANDWEVLGIGEGAAMVTGRAQDPSTLSSWPQLDGVEARKTVSQQDTVDGHAAANLARSSRPPVALQVDLDVGRRPQPSAWQLGDVLDVHLSDPPLLVAMPMRAVGRTWTIAGDRLTVSAALNPTTTDRPALTSTATPVAPTLTVWTVDGNADDGATYDGNVADGTVVDGNTTTRTAAT